MERVNFTQMKDGTAEEYLLLRDLEEPFLERTADRLLDELRRQQDDTLEGYRITRLEHALQCATRALREGADDDRYLRSYDPARGFGEDRIACPDFTGSYLSFDGEHLYMSQWYRERILQYDGNGSIRREINVGAEICGHTFVDGVLYVLRGRENKDVPNKSEEWRIARLYSLEDNPNVEDLATVPFASRSLTFDGKHFWSNHRAANETISFSLPA